MQNQNHPPPPLHRRWVRRRAWPNRLFAAVYASAIAALLYHHTTHLLFHTANVTLSLTMLLADVILAFMWFTHQGFRMNPVRRKTFPENLPKSETKYPAMDVFICTADPEKEPPMVAVNTALSTLAFDYPTEKLSVYLSDDGASEATLFAFAEAAEFAKEWIPYCKENRIMDRSPEAYFSSDDYTCYPRTHEIKMMYESMKAKVEKGDYVINQRDANFTRQHHPTIIQVLLDGTEESDVLGHAMPNLIYVSREKRKATHHHFKAGALNVLLRVSETMTNAPIILTADCDMYSNHPKTPLKALCYFLDPSADSDKIAFLQFPQIFQGINRDDIYGAEFKFIFQINMTGLDGLCGPSHVGTGCFFRRRAFYGGPSSRTVEQARTQSIRSDKVLARCHEVANSDFEAQTKWGSEVSDPWFLLYGFLFVGAYGQEFLEYKLEGGTTRGWYNNQRAWMIRSLSSYTFAVIEYTFTKLWGSTTVFNVTSKVVDQEASTRYKNGMMEFGVESLFFYPISVAALHNIIAFVFGLVGVLKHGGLEDLFMQLLLVGFGVVSSWPIYQAMVFRSDPGKMPLKITVTSFAIASMLYLVAPFVF
ncbi:hypothetical protein OSB04_022643 [Centaurea solstitialis]|uniref:Cellulose synthase-like protein G3 n=1 Tax=Centaurea solstitialis TaxID=347529 RepID=A0AA38WFC3_9ASTR|nr:hypothetical protein OSB04_022643 [Centaurea solstitialis]